MPQHHTQLNDLQLNAYSVNPHAQVCRSLQNPTIHAADVGHHVHSFYELVLVQRGSGSHQVHGTRVPAQPGALTLFGPGSTHEPSGLEGCDFWVLIFNLRAVQVKSWRGALYTERAGDLACVDQLIHALHNDPRLSLTFQAPEAQSTSGGWRRSSARVNQGRSAAPMPSRPT